MTNGPAIERGAMRWFWGAPLTLASLLTGAAATAIVDRAASSLAETRAIHAAMERAAARLAAEATAAAFVDSGGTIRTGTADAGAGIVVHTEVLPSSTGSHQRLRAAVGDQVLDFAFMELSGGTPPALGQPLTVVTGASLPRHWPRPTAVDDFGFLPPALLLGQQSTGPMAWFRREPSIALLQFTGGTDREDYVVAAVATDEAVAPMRWRGVVEVPGNLWFDADAVPVWFELAEDTTLVVHGNVYLGRDVRVRGRGQLTITAVGSSACAYADRDGNGRWSPGDTTPDGSPLAGPVEGAGNIWIGAPKARGGRLEFEVGLVATGSLHLAVDVAVVHGPVALAGDGVVLPGCCGELQATGRRLPSLFTSALPGFATCGRPRPGPLLLLGGEPLYPSSPAR